MRSFAGYLLLICALSAFASDNPSPETPTITLERTSCFGSCPVYKVEIFTNGSVIYEGKEYVRVKGTQRNNVGSDAVKSLIQDFLDLEYFKLEDRYTSIKNPDGTETIVTDLPTTTTSLNLEGRRKRIVDYVGAPEKLKNLERKIDSVAGTKRWIAIDALSVREEVQHGWNINSVDARRLLLDAVRQGDDETVKAFIQGGADVNTPVVNVTLLQVANGVKTVKLLIDAGANVNVSSKEYFGTPLSFAAEQGDLDSIKALIEAGAKVDGRDPDGGTPLMAAAAKGNLEAVQFLLLAGAQSDARDKKGHGALFHARDGLRRQGELAKHPQPFAEVMPEFSNKYKRVQELLVAAGATDDSQTTE